MLSVTKIDADEDSELAKHPERTCVGCRTRDGNDALLRFAFVADHQPALIPDLSGRLGGRGMWVHPRTACVAKAVRGGFARALKRSVQVEPAELLALTRAQLSRRIEGLLVSALRRQWVAVGSDAVLGALAACRVRLLLVAKDAAGRRNELIARASERRVEVVELLDKASLGRLSGRQELGFVAVLELRIAREISDSARWLAGLSEDG